MKDEEIFACYRFKFAIGPLWFKKNLLEFLKENPEKIDWYSLSSNPNAIELLKENKELIDWDQLSQNPNAIELLKANPENINWNLLSLNYNAIELLKENPEKINWNCLSKNRNAIEILEKNQDKINWVLLSSNPSIFTYDYQKIKKNFEELGEEIIAKALHPKRIFRLIEEYGEDEIYNIYFDDD